ncbi:MAG: hypothetical protein WCW66_00055 [Patescibacteria group bacterium]|jgi:hypothetical protein
MTKEQGDRLPTPPSQTDHHGQKPLATTSDFERVQQFSDEFLETYGGHDQIPQGLFLG